jgi:hypothetical protein
MVAAAVLAGCSGGGGANEAAGPSFRDPDTTGGTPVKVSYVKVSYVRFNEEQDMNNPRVSKFVHHYRYMLSEGWKNRRGPRAMEPFEKIWRDIYKAESVPDNVMQELVQRMMAAGFADLRETPMERINVEALRRIERTNDRATGQRTRYITVETEKFKKTVSYADNDDSRADPSTPGARIKGPLMEKFLAVETAMLNIMSAYTIMTSVETESSMPKGR